MINELTKQYLEKLKQAQQSIDSSKKLLETHDGNDEEVLEAHSSEYTLEIGPLKMQVKKSRTVTEKKSSRTSSSQSLDKKEVLSLEDETQQANAIRLTRNDQKPPKSNIDIVV